MDVWPRTLSFLLITTLAALLVYSIAAFVTGRQMKILSEVSDDNDL